MPFKIHRLSIRTRAGVINICFLNLDIWSQTRCIHNTYKRQFLVSVQNLNLLLSSLCISHYTPYPLRHAAHYTTSTCWICVRATFFFFQYLYYLEDSILWRMSYVKVVINDDGWLFFLYLIICNSVIANPFVSCFWCHWVECGNENIE